MSPSNLLFRRLALAIWLPCLLLLALLVISACGRQRPATTDVLAPYQPALKSSHRDDLTLVQDAPRYAINVEVDHSGEWLTGTASIHVTNNSPDPWRDIVFRLYPVLEQYGGNMTIRSVLINGQPVTFVYESDNTAIRVDLPESLPTGRSVVANLNWRLSIPTWPDNSGVYVLFGRSQQMISLPLFYPALAVYEPGPAVGTGHWWLEQGLVRGDAAYNVISLFTVTATLPSDQVPVASGTLITSTALSSAQSRHVWVTGPSREFVLHMSPQLQSITEEAYGTRVTSYWLPGQEAAARAALRYAVGALRIYSDYYGEYPFRDMRLAPAPLSYRGMEYPQVNLLGVELYTRFQNSLEILVAHEVAHQWWYQIVHNDPVRSPWLDEALAEFSVKLYYEALHGADDASMLELQRWQTPLNILADSNEDTVLDRPVSSFQNSSQYETVIYGKGALLYERMRLILGNRRFRRFLQTYLDTYRYQIVTTDSWREALETLDNTELDLLFPEWVRRPQAQISLPSETPDVTETPVEADATSPSPP